MNGSKLVIWGYFTENLGDDLMLKAFLASAKNRYKKIYINSRSEYKALYSALGVKVVSQNTLIFRGLNKLLYLANRPELYFRLLSGGNADFVMLGGSLFMEAQGAGNERQIKNLKYAVDHAKNAYVIGSNFGPYHTEKFLREYRSIFEKCRHICFRDKFSYDLFADIPNVHYAPDIILSGAWDENPKASEADGAIVISAIDLKNRPGLQSKTEEYEKLLADIAMYHMAKGQRVVLAAFCEWEGDVEACRRIKALCGKDGPQIAVYRDMGFLELLSGAKKIYGSRFHSIILAMYYGVPCVPFVYSEKTSNALAAYCASFQAVDITKLPEYSLDDITKNFQSPELLPNIKEAAMRQFEGINECF